jgi:hypothetical protein
LEDIDLYYLDFPGLQNSEKDQDNWFKTECKYPGTTWTAVRAMPLRIAASIGGWQPPISRPQYQKRPDDLVLLASPDYLPE